MKNIDINKLLGGKTPTNITVDMDAEAVYFKVSDEEVTRTERPNNSLSIDYGRHNEVIGIEIIRVKKIERILSLAYKDISSNIPKEALAI